MPRYVIATLAMTAGLLSTFATAEAADPESCKAVRFADVGWTDITSTTAVASTILQALGYAPESKLLSIPVTYTSMKNKDIDVYLGDWQPSMEADRKPFLDDKSIEVFGPNLTGAKYTFAVPKYVSDAGVKDFADLQKFPDQFEKKLYGIEPGSNQLMLDAIKDPALGLSDWEVVESSEQGMLAEVNRHIKDKAFIVFQGWAPHPMNTVIDMKYLTGGDKFYGPDFGAATVSTQVRKGYLHECPNVAKLLENLSFDIAFENRGMGYLMTDGLPPEEAGLKAIAGEAERLDAWLDGVTTFDGQPALAAVRAKLLP